MLSVTKIDDKNIKVVINGKEFVYPAFFRAIANGDNVVLRSDSRASIFDHTEPYTSVEVNGTIHPSSAAAVKALNEFVNFKPGGGSPSPTPTLQAKEVSITENGTREVTPDAGFDGLSKVTVEVDVPGAPALSPNLYINTRTISKFTYRSSGQLLEFGQCGTMGGQSRISVPSGTASTAYAYMESNVNGIKPNQRYTLSFWVVKYNGPALVIAPVGTYTAGRIIPGSLYVNGELRPVPEPMPVGGEFTEWTRFDVTFQTTDTTTTQDVITYLLPTIKRQSGTTSFVVYTCALMLVEGDAVGEPWRPDENGE